MSTGRDGRPVVAVDVDGVLVVHPYSSGERDEYIAGGWVPSQVTAGVEPGKLVTGEVLTRPEHGEWLHSLAALGAELVWCTAWNGEAARVIAPLIGAPAMPVVVVDRHGPAFGWSSKLRPLSSYVGDRPLCWVDDTWGGREMGWAEDRVRDGLPTLLVRVKTWRGLARRDFRRAANWLRSLETPGEGETGEKASGSE